MLALISFTQSHGFSLSHHNTHITHSICLLCLSVLFTTRLYFVSIYWTLTDVFLFVRRLEQQKLEQQKLEQQKLEQQERERQERERQERERQEKERLERERQAAAGQEAPGLLHITVLRHDTAQSLSVIVKCTAFLKPPPTLH